MRRAAYNSSPAVKRGRRSVFLRPLGKKKTRNDDRPTFCFFFQAEDGIRDYKVTGVQTCALPISRSSAGSRKRPLGASEANGTFEAPGIWPATGSIGSTSPR